MQFISVHISRKVNIFMQRLVVTTFILFSLVSQCFSQALSPYIIAEIPWAPGFGNHRAVLEIDQPADAVYLHLAWRRHDKKPDWKRFIIIHETTGDTIQNIKRIKVNNEHCEIAFGPVIQKGTYYFYYLPFEPQEGYGFYSKNYLAQEPPPQDEWIQRNKLDKKAVNKKLVPARSIKIESRTAFDSFYPMEVIAFESEKKDYIRKFKQDYHLFAEDRKHPVRMLDNIPARWLEFPQPASFTGKSCKNEYYVFQIALWASNQDINNVTFDFGTFHGKDSEISLKSFTCINTDGVDPYGNEFKKQVDVLKGKVQPFWIGVDIPQYISEGSYRGAIIVNAENTASKKIEVELQIQNEILTDRGDSEPWRHSRLRWLNSRAGIDGSPVAPYQPIQFLGNSTYNLTGKLLTIGEKGLPSSIKVYGEEILAAPILFVVESNLGVEQFGNAEEIELLKNEPGVASGSWKQYSNNIELRGIGIVESDGWINYRLKVKAKKDLEVKNIRLEIPYKKEIASYIMGMNLPGSSTPLTHEAKWEGPQDAFWLGNVKGGLHCELRGASYSGPLLNLYKPEPPPCWHNEGKGGYRIITNDQAKSAIVYSGIRELKTGEEIEYEFSLIITPVKKTDTQGQFTNRYYHNGEAPWPKQEELEARIKIINVHHANEYNPHINYPFIAVDELKNFVDHWHKEGMKIKLYYTIRELTNYVTEIWALRSLGNEVLGGGGGGGYPWLREHFVDNYRPQWYDWLDSVRVDASVLTSTGESRWFNYYIEGLKWLVQHVGIDGIYLDDVSFDRNMLKRMRKVMDSVKPGCILDLHSNTGFSKGPAIQYTEYFPYVDKLWFGESFKYDEMPPENWLVEVSGIPFGLMGDMLQGGGNPWRGMVYGMTARHPWVTDGVTCDPRSIWKIWDDFGIADSRMVGYWEDNPVVKTNKHNIKATSYVKNNKLLISIASWDEQTVEVGLDIDWDQLNFRASEVHLYAPEIENFQSEKTFELNSAIPVEPKKGWLIIVE